MIRWGIVSAGLIATDFCLALRTLPADEHQVVVFPRRTHIATALSVYQCLAWV